MRPAARILLLCLAVLLAACAQNPERKGGTAAAKANVELGIQYMRAGMKAVALEKLKKALQQDPRLPEAHNAIAVLYENLGEIELAEEHFRKALALDPDDSQARNNFGNFLCRHGNWEEAEKQFVLASQDPLHEHPEMPLANAGICAKLHGDLDKAEKYLRQAVRTNPLYPTALLQMAKLMLEKKEYMRARAYLQRFQSVSKPTAESLWIGIQTERALGDRNAEASYALMLRNRFPDSPFTRRLAGERDGGDGGAR